MLRLEPSKKPDLPVKAIRLALEDAGLSVDDLDGFAYYSGGYDSALIAQLCGCLLVAGLSKVLKPRVGAPAHPFEELGVNRERVAGLAWSSITTQSV